MGSISSVFRSVYQWRWWCWGWICPTAPWSEPRPRSAVTGGPWTPRRAGGTRCWSLRGCWGSASACWSGSAEGAANILISLPGFLCGISNSYDLLSQILPSSTYYILYLFIYIYISLVSTWLQGHKPHGRRTIDYDVFLKHEFPTFVVVGTTLLWVMRLISLEASVKLLLPFNKIKVLNAEVLVWFNIPEGKKYKALTESPHKVKSREKAFLNTENLVARSKEGLCFLLSLMTMYVLNLTEIP